MQLRGKSWVTSLQAGCLLPGDMSTNVSTTPLAKEQKTCEHTTHRRRRRRRGIRYISRRRRRRDDRLIRGRRHRRGHRFISRRRRRLSSQFIRLGGLLQMQRGEGHSRKSLNVRTSMFRYNFRTKSPRFSPSSCRRGGTHARVGTMPGP